MKRLQEDACWDECKTAALAGRAASMSCRGLVGRSVLIHLRSYQMMLQIVVLSKCSLLEMSLEASPQDDRWHLLFVPASCRRGPVLLAQSPDQDGPGEGRGLLRVLYARKHLAVKGLREDRRECCKPPLPDLRLQ